MANRKRPYVEKRGDRWRVRWPDSAGIIRSASRDDHGQPFTDAAAAERYGWEQMGQIARGTWLDPRRSSITFTAWVTEWWAINRIDELAEKTARRYRADIELHFLPVFGERTLAELADGDAVIARWLTQHRANYAENTVNYRRDLLSTILNDAVASGRMGHNPMAASKRRGRKAKRGSRRPEKAWATPLQALLIAERATVYAHDDPAVFVMYMTLAYTGMRGRELVGLERRNVHADRLDVEWQLVEYTGRLERERPKYDSRRRVDVPLFLADLLRGEMRRHDGLCGCRDHDGGPYVLPGGPSTRHFGSVSCNNWFRAAASSRYFSKTHGYLPVPVIAGPFVGRPIHGRRAGDATWVPILPGATPHSLRHSHRVWMDDDGIPEVLKHERLGHEMTGIRATYSHVSQDARERLCAALTARWEQSLRARAAMYPTSPVPLLDDLIRPFREQARAIECSTNAPMNAVSPLRARKVENGRRPSVARADTA